MTFAVTATLLTLMMGGYAVMRETQTSGGMLERQR